MVQRLNAAQAGTMMTRALREAGSGYRLPRLAAASGLLLTLAANAAFAGPPGDPSSQLTLAASSPLGRSSQVAASDGGHDWIQAVSYSATIDDDAGRSSAPLRGEVDAGDGDSAKVRPRLHSLEDLVVEFLEKL
jgi:hypothetical protein